MQKIIKITTIDDWNNEVKHFIICDETEVEEVCSNHLKSTNVTNIAIITPTIVSNKSKETDKRYDVEILAQMLGLIIAEKCIWDGNAYVKTLKSDVVDKYNFDILYIGYNADGVFLYSSNEDDTEQHFITLKDIDEKNLQLILSELENEQHSILPTLR